MPKDPRKSHPGHGDELQPTSALHQARWRPHHRGLAGVERIFEKRGLAISLSATAFPSA